MLPYYLFLNSLIFIIGIIGIALNRQSILVTIMSIELMLLSLNLNFVVVSAYLDDMAGHLFCLFILTVAASESSIGLAILLGFYDVFGTVRIEKITTPMRH